MVFASGLFVFLFLPVVLLVHFLLPRRARNAWLLLASLLFYAWGEKLLVGLMLLSIGANWLFGRGLARAGRPGGRGVLLWAVSFNLLLLVSFKYADWLWDALWALLSSLGAGPAPAARLGELLVAADSPWRPVLLTDQGRI